MQELLFCGLLLNEVGIMTIKQGESYYVVSDEYSDWLPLMSYVKVHDDGYFDCNDPYVVLRGSDGSWVSSGYIKPEHLLTAQQILKLYQEHMVMVDALERNG